MSKDVLCLSGPDRQERNGKACRSKQAQFLVRNGILCISTCNADPPFVDLDLRGADVRGEVHEVHGALVGHRIIYSRISGTAERRLPSKVKASRSAPSVPVPAMISQPLEVKVMFLAAVLHRDVVIFDDDADAPAQKQRRQSRPGAE